MGGRARASAETGAGTGLCLVAEARDGPAWHARVAAALEATRAATLLLAAPEDAALAPAAARPLVELAQRREVAALIVDDAAAARATGADGVHLTARPDIEDAYRAARAALGPRAIVGAEAGTSRHDAMLLGEAGADYVGFARTPGDAGCETTRELVAWWAEVFVVPVVAFGIETPEEAAACARAGADFVAVRLPRDGSAETDRAWAAAVAAALAAPADAA